FHPEQVRAAFVRCFASLLYTYKKFLRPASGDKRRAGLVYDFNMEAFLKSLPHEHEGYMSFLQQTQGRFQIAPFWPAYLHYLWGSKHLNIFVQVSMSLSASGKELIRNRRIRRPLYSMRSSFVSGTVDAPRSSPAVWR